MLGFHFWHLGTLTCRHDNESAILCTDNNSLSVELLPVVLICNGGYLVCYSLVENLCSFVRNCGAWHSNMASEFCAIYYKLLTYVQVGSRHAVQYFVGAFAITQHKCEPFSFHGEFQALGYKVLHQKLTDRQVYEHQVLCRQRCQVVYVLLCMQHQIHLDRSFPNLSVRCVISAAIVPDNIQFNHAYEAAMQCISRLLRQCKTKKTVCFAKQYHMHIIVNNLSV